MEKARLGKHRCCMKGALLERANKHTRAHGYIGSTSTYRGAHRRPHEHIEEHMSTYRGARVVQEESTDEGST